MNTRILYVNMYELPPLRVDIIASMYITSTLLSLSIIFECKINYD